MSGWSGWGHDVPDGYEYGDLTVVTGSLYHDASQETVWECSRCSALVKDTAKHDTRCPRDLLCDGCGQVGPDRKASDDGRGLFCPPCLAGLRAFG